VAPSIGRLQVGVVYLVVYLLTYVTLISPNFTGLGIVNRLAGDGSLLAAAAIAVLPAGWLPRAAARPSDASLWILYLAAYVPSVVVPPFVLGTGWALLPLWLTLGTSFAMVLLLVRGSTVSIPTLFLPERVYGWLLIVLAIAGVALILAVFGIPTRIPSLDEVSGARLDFRESLAGAGRFAGYAVWWTGGVVAPLLIAYGAWTRQGRLAAMGFFVLALIYASAAFRSMVFIALLVVVLLVLVARLRRDFGAAVGWLTSLLIAACALVAMAGIIIPLSLLVRRLLVVPGQVLGFYYDAFSTGPVYLLSHSILGGLVPRPYPETPPILIGTRYFNDPAINANGNLWADGMANLGLPGIVVASLGLALVLIVMDAVTRGKPAILAVTVGAIGIWSLTNSGLLTTLLTHGLGVMLVMFWLMPRATRRVDHEPIVRVAHVTTVHPSDDPRIYLKECATLAAAGYEVVLIGQGAAPSTDVGVRFVSIGVAHGRLSRMIVQPMRVLLAARRVRARLYHLHDPELLPVGVILRLFGARVVYDAHEDLPRQIAYKPYLPEWVRKPVAVAAATMEQGAARILDAVVAATPRIAARFPEARVALVQNFPTTREFGEPPPHGYAERPPLVAYVGRLTPEVGARVMADAARILIWDRRDLRVVLAGPAEPALAADLRARTVPAPVELPGRIGRPEVVGLLHGARVGLVLFQPVANYVEAYPTKLFEYMASELPVVASDFPVWRDIVADVDCGLLVDPTDPEAVAEAVRTLLDDPERAAAMGRRGRAAVMERYRWEPQGERLVGLYRRILAADPADAPVPAPAIGA
jgi:glycosyltransferase involved in cell wall biosynthesis